MESSTDSVTAVHVDKFLFQWHPGFLVLFFTNFWHDKVIYYCVKCPHFYALGSFRGRMKHVDLSVLVCAIPNKRHTFIYDCILQ